MSVILSRRFAAAALGVSLSTSLGVGGAALPASPAFGGEHTSAHVTTAVAAAASDVNIVFAKSCQIWVMDGDGSNQRQLTTTGSPTACFSSPTISRTGQYVAFEQSMSLRLLDRATGAIKDLGPGGHPDFSPINDLITYHGRSLAPGGETGLDVFTRDLAGTNVTQLTHSSGAAPYSYSPVWSGDGTSVIYSSSSGVSFCRFRMGTFDEVPRYYVLQQVASAGGAPATLISDPGNAIYSGAQGGGVLAYERAELSPREKDSEYCASKPTLRSTIFINGANLGVGYGPRVAGNGDTYYTMATFNPAPVGTFYPRYTDPAVVVVRAGTSSPVTLAVGGYMPDTGPAYVSTPPANPIASTTRLSVPAILGYGATGPATITVTAAGGTPAGTVTLKDGAAVIGTATLTVSGSTGTAKITLPAALRPGAHSLVATYSGDPTGTPPVKASASAASSLLVKARSAVLGRIAASEIQIGNTTTWVRVNVTTSPASYPAGLVSILDGKRTIRSALLRPVNKGQLWFRLPALALGSHAISVAYAGDAATVGSVSKPVTISIVKTLFAIPAPTSKRVAAAPAAIARGGSVPAIGFPAPPTGSYSGQMFVPRCGVDASGRIVVGVQAKATQLWVPKPNARYYLKVKMEINNPNYYVGFMSHIETKEYETYHFTARDTPYWVVAGVRSIVGTTVANQDVGVNFKATVTLYQEQTGIDLFVGRYYLGRNGFQCAVNVS